MCSNYQNANRILWLIQFQSKPYFMLKESNQTLSGNDRFEGFCMDIIDEISKMLGFKYVFQIVGDLNYGNPNKETGEWNGMIRELLDGVRTHMSIFSYIIYIIAGILFIYTES